MELKRIKLIWNDKEQKYEIWKYIKEKDILGKIRTGEKNDRI